MPVRLVSVLRAAQRANHPDDVLNVLHKAVAPKLQLCAVWQVGPADEHITFRHVLYHRAVSKPFRDEALELGARHGLSPMAQLALIDPLPFTFSEARQIIQPRGDGHWVFDLFQRHGMRDGFYCPHGSWMILFTSNQALKGSSVLAPETRMIADTAAGIAVYRLKEMARRKSPPKQEMLSAREVLALRHLSFGHEAGEVAAALGVTINTAKTYVLRAQRKLRARNRTHAIAIALRRRLI